MPAWQAWLLAAGTSLAALAATFFYHQVTIILLNFEIFYFLLVFPSSLYVWFTNACRVLWFNIS
jgi:hypothetical protein